MQIEFEQISPNTVELTKFYRRSGPPGEGRQALMSMLSSFPKSIKWVVLDASGGTSARNTRSFFQKLTTKDTRDFAGWSPERIGSWLVEHKVDPGISAWILSMPPREMRKWTRIVATNEKLVKYYERLGFHKEKNFIGPTVRMRANINSLVRR
jgi:hypothetical protein